MMEVGIMFVALILLILHKKKSYLNMECYNIFIFWFTTS